MNAVYLFFGLVLMLLLVANVYDVPELNFGRYFYLRSDEGNDEADERQRLQSPSDGSGPPPHYSTTDPTTSDQDVGSGGGGGGSKRSKKAEDKKRLTDDSL